MGDGPCESDEPILFSIRAQLFFCVCDAQVAAQLTQVAPHLATGLRGQLQPVKVPEAESSFLTRSSMAVSRPGKRGRGKT